MLYLIGLGLNIEGISQEGLLTAKRCKTVYLENYTVEFPYNTQGLGEIIGKKIIPADRELVESLSIVGEAKKKDVALLVYGAPLTATTHITILDEAKKENVKYKIIYSGSVFDAIAETGLQLYKFGKVTSMPRWDSAKHFNPTSFMEIVKENQSIGAHSLILIDIGLEFSKSIEELKSSAEEHEVKLDKIVICSQLGTGKSKVYYGKISNLENKKVWAPFCIIIPGKLHFAEEEFLKNI